MVNGLTRLTPEARMALKDLRHDIYKKTGKDLTLKKIGSFLIVVASKNDNLIKELTKKDC